MKLPVKILPQDGVGLYQRRAWRTLPGTGKRIQIAVMRWDPPNDAGEGRPLYVVVRHRYFPSDPHFLGSGWNFNRSLNMDGSWNGGIPHKWIRVGLGTSVSQLRKLVKEEGPKILFEEDRHETMSTRGPGLSI